jgi:hypothetical protein
MRGGEGWNEGRRGGEEARRRGRRGGGGGEDIREERRWKRSGETTGARMGCVCRTAIAAI